ncbi:hypothetical protein NECAME_14728 [Necator americanus]|uniref:Uncharacterized protein n=1 Tax=Necator americanus TaxID=51031 RepID=W2SNQ6_NECAM|nr:hypothetical protein NECAME_14728 [Necator americanus]ETN70506.1 hypothetical protein NECAME_14728 [Necator americanus]
MHVSTRKLVSTCAIVTGNRMTPPPHDFLRNYPTFVCHSPQRTITRLPRPPEISRDRDDMEALEDESRAADEKTGVQPIISPQNPIPEPDKSWRRGSRIDINNLAS